MRHTKHLRYRLFVKKAGNQYSKGIIAIILLTIIVIFITGYELRLLWSELLINRIAAQEIDYEAFRELKISEEVLEEAKSQAEDLKRKYPDLGKIPFVDETGCLTFSMMAYSYDLRASRLVDEQTFRRGVGVLIKSEQFLELYRYYHAIFSDLKYFPVPRVADQSATVTYVDSWYQPRTYGGDRKHEGTDLMASNNRRGFFPVISMTDGIVEKIGWLPQGGYRIGIRSGAGGYFYYAHLYSYAPGLEQGDTVIAGQLLGFMGDSGYGSEGTIGQFDVHLHLGIYVNTEEGEMSVNPYMVLKELEKNRMVYSD